MQTKPERSKRIASLRRCAEVRRNSYDIHIIIPITEILSIILGYL